MGQVPDGELARTGELVAEAWDTDVLEGEGADVAALLREGALELPGGDHLPPGDYEARGVLVYSDFDINPLKSNQLASTLVRFTIR